MILTVRKKPVVVEAIFWDGKVSTMQELESMGMKYGACMQQGSKVHYLTITTLEGEMKAEIGDWIIKGIKGEFYPCKPDIFELTYERENLVDEKIKDALLSYRCQYTQTDEGGADLIDVLTPSDENDRKSGTKELELLSEHIACALVEE